MTTKSWGLTRRSISLSGTKSYRVTLCWHPATGQCGIPLLTFICSKMASLSYVWLHFCFQEFTRAGRARSTGSARGDARGEMQRYTKKEILQASQQRNIHWSFRQNLHVITGPTTGCEFRTRGTRN